MAFITRSLPTVQSTRVAMGTKMIYAVLHKLQHSPANPPRLVQQSNYYELTRSVNLFA